jgi:hypothetical protein
VSVSLDLVLQLTVLAALALFLPLRLARLLPWRLGMVLVNLALSALILWLVGLLMLALPYLWQGVGLMPSLRADPWGGLIWLARLGAMPMLLWAPLLLLMELVIAQRIAQQPQRRRTAG